MKCIVCTSETLQAVEKRAYDLFAEVSHEEPEWTDPSHLVEFAANELGHELSQVELDSVKYHIESGK